MSISVEDRDRLLAAVSPEQREYLMTRLIRSRRTTFANIMARHKGAVVPPNSSFEEIEALLDEWVYTGYIDAGEVSPELRCECGRPLRYQHIVEHKSTGQVLKFGINHLQEHLGIDAKIVQDIMDGFRAVDYELDEILEKFSGGWSNASRLPSGYESVSLPDDIQEQLSYDLPLLNSQIAKIRSLIASATQSTGRAAPKPPTYRTAAAAAQPEMDLFSLPEFTGSGLSTSAKEVIEGYLQSGIRSARIICEKLIQAKRVSDERFLTDKPKIYIDVCFYLDEFVINGYCKLLEASQEDRKYAWI